MLQGSIQTRGDRGSAHFSLPLKGSKAEGTLYAEAYPRIRRYIRENPRRYRGDVAG